MTERVYLTILIYITKGKEAQFEEYESLALPRLAVHGGRLECRLRPEAVDGGIDLPDEVHLLSFETADGFAAYRADRAVQAAAALREESVERAVIIRGRAME